MNTHLSDDTLKSYRGRTLTPTALLDADDHLAECEGCRARLAGEAAAAAATVTPAASAAVARVGSNAPAVVLAGALSRDAADDLDAGRPFHMSADLLGGYVDGTLDEIDAEIAESHLASCAKCREEAEDLRRFRAILSTYPAITVSPQAAAAEEPRARRAAARPSWLPWAAFAPIAAGAVVGAFYLGAASSSPRPTDGGSELARLRADNAQLSARAEDALRQAEQARNSAASAQYQIARLRSENGRLIAAVDASRAVPPTPAPLVRPSATPAPDTAPRLTAPKTLLASVRDGASGKLGVDRSGKVIGGESLPADLRRAVASALRNGALPAFSDAARTSLAALAPVVGSVVRGPKEDASAATDRTFSPSAPLNIRVLTGRPTFRWKPLTGADVAGSAPHYVVRVFDAADYSPVAESGLLSKTEWTPEKALPRGRAYVWQVAAQRTAAGGSEEVVTPRPPAPEAKFAVLADTEATALTRDLARADDSRLARGLAYWRTGLLDEAARELDALRAANPDVPAVKKLTEQLAKERAGGTAAGR
jgi:hypothetical protein